MAEGGGEGGKRQRLENEKSESLPEDEETGAGAAGPSNPKSIDHLENKDAEMLEDDVKLWCNPSWRMSLLKPRHIDFCRRLIFKKLPSQFEEYDTQRYLKLQTG